MSDQNEEKYRQKVREVLADGRLTDLEDTTLGFYQHTLKISDETAMRIFEEVLKEVTAKAGEQPNAVEESGSALKKDEPPKTQQTDKQSIDKESAERITYQSWDEFEKAQYQKGALYKEFMPIAKQFHDMLMSTFQEENKPVEPRYGESTFSFSVPKDLAKSRKRTFASFGMLNLVTQKCYIQNLYKEADDELPEGSRLYKKSDPTVYVYSFCSMSEYESVKPDLKACIIRSYELLSSEKVKGKSEQSSADDESWTLLQDLCYLYYIVAYLPIFLGSKDTKNIKLRIDAATETIFEWLSDDVDGEQLVKEAVGIVTKAWSGDGIKVGYKTKELAAKIKNNMPEENQQLVIKDLQYIVNKWSPNKDYDKKLIERITRVILDDGGSADEETATPSTGDKGTFDSEHIYGMAYVYFDVVMQNDEQSKDEFQAKVHVINEKLSEWAQDSDRITEIMQNCWKTYIHDNDDRETYEGKLEQYIFEMKDNMSEEQLSIVIADLFEIVDISANAHKAEISMIKGLAEIFGFSLEVDQSDTIIKSTKDCLTNDTDPPYPGQFCIPGTLYEDRFRYMPFPKVVGKSTKYKADDLFRRFTSDEVSKIVTKIETESKIPYLVFIKGILDSKMNLPNKAPYWFMPFVIAGRTEGVMLYFDQDGFWYNNENPIVLKQCSPAEMIDSIEIKEGHFNDFVMELFKKDMPSLTVDEGIISTMRISGNDKGRAVEVDIAEMHGEGYGPQLEIMEAIWNIWKDVVEKSRGASSYMFDPAIFKAFNSWQEVIDWAYESEEKSPGEKKSKEPGKVKAEDDIDARDEDGKTALIRAAEKGDTETVKLFLDRGADIETKDNEGKTALMLAAGQGHAKTVELLLDKGADIEADIKSDDEDGGHRALHFAAKEGHTETVELLLSRGADIEAKTNACWTPLMLAAWSGHKEAVGLLLDKGADIEVEDDSGWRALHYASVTGCSETVELLLDREVDIEAKTNDCDTALSLAARNGETETIKLLLDRGADIEAKDNEGKTALIMAAIEGHTEIVELLLDRGADIEARDEYGMTALIFAANTDQTEMVELLLNRGADIEAKTNDGDTALIQTVVFGNTKTAALLIERGADKKVKNINEWTELIWAAFLGSTEKIRLLIDEGADIEAKGNDGYTALILAARNGHTEAVELLLDRGANIEAKTNDGYTALILAARNGHTEAVELLLDRGADIEAKTNDGDTALILGTCNSNKETVELLIDRGADIEAKTNDGDTALILAANSSDTGTVRLLLDKGADIEAESEDGWRALHYYAHFGLTETDELILDRKANIEAKTNDGQTALIIAAKQGQTETVELLLDKGADLEAKTDDGRTALMLAANEGHTGTVELLLDRKADIEAKDNEGKTALMLAEENGEAEVVKCFKKLAAGRNKEAAQNEEAMQKQETKEQADAETTQEAASKTEVQMISDEGEKEISQSEKLYRRKVMDVLADGVVSDLERTGLDFTQHKLKLTDEDALRIFDEILAETLKKAAVQAVKTRTDDMERAAVEESMSEETGEKDDVGGNSGKKRITYSTWEEFEKGQGEDPRKKRFMPIARKIRELVIEALEEQNLQYEVRYGGGTFSFSVPKDNAKSGKRTFSRFGLLDHTLSRTYFDSLYMAEGESLPERAQFMSDGSSRCSYDLASLEDFEKVEQALKKGVVKSYRILAK